MEIISELEKNKKVRNLEIALTLSWREDTSSDSDGWTKRNPHGEQIIKNMYNHLHLLTEPDKDKKATTALLELLGNPAWGQCAVTALVVNDYLGGKLVRVPVINMPEMTSHYYNELPDGTYLDLTKSQFNNINVKFGEKEYRERDYVLSPKYPQTIKRYEILSARLREFMASKFI